MDKAVQKKSYSFSVRVVNACNYLRDERREFEMSKQLLRSGTAIRALVSEAQHAESKADFIHKMNIALKEAKETQYWIELLHETKYLNKPTFSSMDADVTELLKLLISIIKSTKNQKKHKKQDNHS